MGYSYKTAQFLIDARLADGVCTVSRGSQDLLRFAFDPSGRVTLARGQAHHAGGWVSERFGEKTPAPRIAWTRVGPGPAIETRITVLP